MEETAIKVNNLSKTFKLPHEKNSSIKSLVVSFYKADRSYEIQKALNDVSFEVKQGEFFGIVGRNGSGKSTLLKLLAGIYEPTNGGVQVNGSLTPFIELGVGFNQELSGRENIFLNGALLGFSRKEMQSMYKDIVTFAELEKFMDQKLKNYSSGMQVRLAFSIAIRAKSDILILDEVLAVGDESFQRKCLDVFEDYRNNKRTVVLVTHDMATVKRFCTRAILINNGKLIAEGDPATVADGYSKLNQDQIDKNSEVLKIDEDSDLKVSIKNSAGKSSKRFEHGDKMRVELSWPSNKNVNAAGVTISTTMGTCVYATNTFIDNTKVDGERVTCVLNLDIGEGKYYITAGTFLDRPENQVDFVTHGPVFSVNAEHKIKGEGITRLKHDWVKE